MKRKRIIIVGGGFAGIQIARNLDANLFDILLIDKLNYHQFQPLFYQVATAQLEPSSISFPLRKIFSETQKVTVRLGEVIEVDKTKKLVKTSIGEFEFDYLILALGCTTNYFNNEAIAKYSFPLKSTSDAIAIRNHVLLTFEKILSANAEDKKSLLNLVIVGAGPTGVELSGAFAEIKRDVLPKDYRGIDFSKFNIFLIEGSNNTLNTMSDKAKAASELYLKRLGVKIYKNTFVKEYDGKTLSLSTGDTLESHTVIWAAGVYGNKIQGFNDENYSTNNRLKVDERNKVLNCNSIYALGDIASMSTQKYPKGHPQVANVAINQAKLLAKNLKLIEQGKPTKAFVYMDKGSMATIGKNMAVVDLPYFSFKGILAWLVWMFLHLMLILSVKNKLIIFIHWTWAYFSKDSSLRLILKQNKEASLTDT